MLWSMRRILTEYWNSNLEKLKARPHNHVRLADRLAINGMGQVRSLLDHGFLNVNTCLY